MYLCRAVDREAEIPPLLQCCFIGKIKQLAAWEHTMAIFAADQVHVISPGQTYEGKRPAPTWTLRDLREPSGWRRCF